MEKKEEFYFDLHKECLKEQTAILKQYQKKMAKRTVGTILLAIVFVELFEIIKSLLICNSVISKY